MKALSILARDLAHKKLVWSYSLLKKLDSEISVEYETSVHVGWQSHSIAFSLSSRPGTKLGDRRLLKTPEGRNRKLAFDMRNRNPSPNAAKNNQIYAETKIAERWNVKCARINPGGYHWTAAKGGSISYLVHNSQLRLRRGTASLCQRPFV
jgi:hypothetical protein